MISSTQANLCKESKGPEEVEIMTDKIAPKHNKLCTKKLDSKCSELIADSERTAPGDMQNANKLKSK